MRVKICGIREEADIDTVVKADADAAGFLVGQVHPSPDFILASTAARLAKMLPPYITPVLVTHLTDPEEIKEIVDKSAIFSVQLHGGCTYDSVKELNRLLPNYVKLIFSAHVVGDTVEPDLDLFYPLIDAVLLDSYNKDKDAVGGTGIVHNWEISAEIVKISPVPVILAGGLSVDNVAEAVRSVCPYGVDANSSLKDKDGKRDPVQCREFVRVAKKAGEYLD